jgi:hypothetical protein
VILKEIETNQTFRHHKLEENGGFGSNLRTESLSAVARDVERGGGATLACTTNQADDSAVM